MSMLTGIPAQLRHIKPYFDRAREVENVEPAIAYHCRLYALEQCAKVMQPSPEIAKFMGDVMTVLEKSKSVIKGIDAKERVKAFADKIFTQADQADRASRATKSTAQSFYAASSFYEVSRNLSGDDEEIRERIKYAKWRAARITRAIVNNESPPPPSVVSERLFEVTAEMNSISAELQREQEQEQMKQDVIQDHGHAPMPDFNKVIEANIKQQPDATHDIHFVADANLAPNIQLMETNQLDYQSDALNLPPSYGTSTDMAEDGSSTSQLHQHMPVPSAPEHDQGFEYNHLATGSNVVDEEKLALAKKYAKWAISAIDFDDAESARENLLKSLQALQ